MNQTTKVSVRRAPRVRQAKLKSVTFTGCWTCRTRKVKCDERQENGCAACEKARIDCEGYRVNLCWLTGKSQHQKGLRRRQMKLGAPWMPNIA
ncbi:hypothetical protein N7462_001422 [Penicillium macrosclerotiorum]|uniref:uncharacterized protein n=1 Tax=Penicillium macrosclerotiorum TaxID=303699 RepID=UPI0025474C7F|nr:uncharacterized protein N7462_001422 [Penicillium macrosclerotiorum]KAJ5691999.1 hypothetical protein N7462_001422 [Penicillium macrosclerotiorum]